MKEKLLKIFWYPKSAQWEEDYRNGVDTRVKACISGIITGVTLSTIPLALFWLLQ